MQEGQEEDTTKCWIEWPTHTHTQPNQQQQRNPFFLVVIEQHGATNVFRPRPPFLIKRQHQLPVAAATTNPTTTSISTNSYIMFIRQSDNSK